MRPAALLFIVFLLFVACAPVAPLPTITKTECNPPYFEYTKGDCCLDSDTNGICDRDEAGIIGPIVINKTVIQGPEPVLERTVMPDAIAKFRKKVDGYSYVKGKAQYAVKGSQIRVTLDKVTSLQFSINKTPAHITDVYVDRTSKRAIGYCDPRTEEDIMGTFDADRSKCLALVNQEITLKYDDYNPLLPEDWLLRYQNVLPARVEATDQYVRDLSGWKAVNPVVYFIEGQNEVILRLEANSGLPVKIEINEPTRTRIEEYNKFISNSVKTEDVTYQPTTR